MAKDIVMYPKLHRALTRELAKILGKVYFRPEEEPMSLIEDAFKTHKVYVGYYLGDNLYELRDDDDVLYNRRLHLSFYRMPSGNDEVTGYIS